MNAVEKLTAAIEKLEGIRGNGEDVWTAAGRTIEDQLGTRVAQDMLTSDAKAVETLHRTIDAQLAILRDALSQYASDYKGPPSTNARAQLYLDLADAILGGVS